MWRRWLYRTKRGCAEGGNVERAGLPPRCLLGFGAGKSLLVDWSKQDAALCVVGALRETWLYTVIVVVQEDGQDLVEEGGRTLLWRPAADRSGSRPLEAQFHTNVFQRQQVKKRTMDSPTAEGCPTDQGPLLPAVSRWLLFVCICICLPRGKSDCVAGTKMEGRLLEISVPLQISRILETRNYDSKGGIFIYYNPYFDVISQVRLCVDIDVSLCSSNNSCCHFVHRLSLCHTVWSQRDKVTHFMRMLQEIQVFCFK